MARYSDSSAITTQPAVPTRAQCFSVPNHVSELVIAAEMDVDVATGVSHVIWGYFGEAVPTDTPILKLAEFQNLETVPTRGKYRWRFPLDAGLDITEIGIQLDVGAGAIASESVQVYFR